ncbi:hypothetical protein YQE_12174, partial [Dendroctonus ponderosae]
MRKSGNQNGKSSSSYGKELDLIGVAQKNMDLAKDNVKLRAQNAQLTSELVCIKNQQFQVQRKEAELKKNIKSQMPHFALMVTYLMEYCESDVTVPNKIFRSRVSSKQNNSTQRVGPHMVNGIVLNASPKISLTRMNPVCSSAGLSSTSTNSIEPAHSESASLSSANSDSSEHNVRDEDFIFRTHRNPFGTSSDGAILVLFLKAVSIQYPTVMMGRRIPIVVLENLPLSSKRLQLGDDTQTELENNSLDTISGSNSNSNLSDKTTKSKSKSTNKGKKRKLVEDGDETSQVVPKHDLPSTSSLSRPQRLAKPTDLKEMGLKQKLRRT